MLAVNHFTTPDAFIEHLKVFCIEVNQIATIYKPSKVMYDVEFKVDPMHGELPEWLSQLCNSVLSTTGAKHWFDKSVLMEPVSEEPTTYIKVKMSVIYEKYSMENDSIESAAESGLRLPLTAGVRAAGEPSSKASANMFDSNVIDSSLGVMDHSGQQAAEKATNRTQAKILTGSYTVEPSEKSPNNPQKQNTLLDYSVGSSYGSSPSQSGPASLKKTVNVTKSISLKRPSIVNKSFQTRSFSRISEPKTSPRKMSSQAHSKVIRPQATVLNTTNQRPRAMGTSSFRQSTQNRSPFRSRPLNTTMGRSGSFNTTTGRSGSSNTTKSRPRTLNTTTGRPGPLNTTTGRPGPLNTTTGRPGPLNTTRNQSFILNRSTRRPSTLNRSIQRPSTLNRSPFRNSPSSIGSPQRSSMSYPKPSSFRHSPTKRFKSAELPIHEKVYSSPKPKLKLKPQVPMNMSKHESPLKTNLGACELKNCSKMLPLIIIGSDRTDSEQELSNSNINRTPSSSSKLFNQSGSSYASGLKGNSTLTWALSPDTALNKYMPTYTEAEALEILNSTYILPNDENDIMNVSYYSSIPISHNISSLPPSFIAGSMNSSNSSIQPYYSYDGVPIVPEPGIANRTRASIAAANQQAHNNTVISLDNSGLRTSSKNVNQTRSLSSGKTRSNSGPTTTSGSNKTTSPSGNISSGGFQSKEMSTGSLGLGRGISLLEELEQESGNISSGGVQNKEMSTGSLGLGRGISLLEELEASPDWSKYGAKPKKRTQGKRRHKKTT